MAIYQDKKTKKWYFRKYYINANGENKQYKSKKYNTKRETLEGESQFQYKLINNDNIKEEKFKLVFDEWMDEKKQKLKITTYYGFSKMMEKWIYSFFKNYKISNINSILINKWKKSLSNKNISLKYQNSLINYMKIFLKWCSYNYSLDERCISRLLTYRIDEPVEKNLNFWTYDEYSTFIKVVDNDQYKLIFEFLYYTGVRIGEMLAFTWEDIDFDKKSLRINKSLCYKCYKELYVITSPKTHNSNRNIDLNDNLIKHIKNYQDQEIKIYGYNTSRFLFGNIRPIPQTNLLRALNKYILKSSVKKITLHGFRHSHASLLINCGCDSREVADRLGDTIQIVESTYYHIFPKKQKNIVNTLNNLEK